MLLLVRQPTLVGVDWSDSIFNFSFSKVEISPIKRVQHILSSLHMCIIMVYCVRSSAIYHMSDADNKER